MAINTLNLKIKNDNFHDFLDKLKDLSAIDTTIKVKIDDDNILMYSMLMNGNAIMAMKAFLLNTSDIFDIKESIDIDLVIKDSARLVRQLNFLDLSEEVKWKLDYKEVENCNHVRSSLITNKKFKITSVGGELSEIKNISKDFLSDRLDRSNAKWGFSTSGEIMSDIKKLSSIYNEEKVISLDVNKGTVSFSELGKWDLEIDNIDESISENLMFSKRYLSNINMNESNIYIDAFETFIMVSDSNSNLILSFEQTYEND